MKFKQGWVASSDLKKVRNIVVDSPIIRPMDLLVGAASIAAGAWFLMRRAFTSGSKAFDEAYTSALNDVGCLRDDGYEASCIVGKEE